MENKIEIINNWNISKIFENLENGNYKIPKFQREYVWERSKIVKLLNSIYKQYPIGSFFVWVTDLKYKNFCREIKELGLPLEPENNQYSFILDGQQRITSLYVALKGKKTSNTDYSSICFNLDRKEFHLPRLKSEKNNIPAWKLFDTSEYGDILTDYAIYDRENNTEYAKIWRECQQIFSDYPISIIKTLKMELDEVVEIFERINQGGKRLSLFDLVAASVWSEDFDLREKIKSFNSETNIKQFGELDNEIFTQSLSLNMHSDCKNQTQLKLTSEECGQIWDQTEKTIKLSIDYVRLFGVKYVDLLPYNSFLPIIQYYFYKSGKQSIQSEDIPYIENWFWSATFSQRYSSSSLTKMKEDADWINQLVVGNKLNNVFGVSLSIKELLKINMQNASVIKNGVLCLMALKNPVDFDNGINVNLDRSNISRANAKENHHFFPFSLQEKFNTDNKGINRLVNFAFISGRLNREILNKYPEKYLHDYSQQNVNIKTHLASHYIDCIAFEYALKNDYDGFINQRGKLILEEINKKVRNSEVEYNEIIENNIED